MAQYSHLQIYTKAFELLRELYQRVPGFDKQYKYFLGGRIIENAVEIIRFIIQANGKEGTKRTETIEQLCLEIETLITNLRIANELRQLGGQKSYLFLSDLAVGLSKQAEGWKKYNPRNV